MDYRKSLVEFHAPKEDFVKLSVSRKPWANLAKLSIAAVIASAEARVYLALNVVPVFNTINF
jgi:hypothetical protein